MSQQRIGVRKCLFIGAVLVVAVCGSAIASSLTMPQLDEVRWQSQSDDVYLQEVGQIIKSADPCLDVASFGGRWLVVTAKGIQVVDAAALIPASGGVFDAVRISGATVRNLWVVGSELWIGCEGKLFRLADNALTEIGSLTADDVSLAKGALHVLSSNTIHVWDGEKLKPLPGGKVRMGVNRLAWHAESFHIAGSGQLKVFDGRMVDYVYDPYDWGELPSRNIRDLISTGDRLLIATDRGLGVMRGMGLTKISGSEGLPFEDLTCLARGFGQDVWIGTSRGAVRMIGDEFHYFGAQRWLPSDKVNAIASSERSVCIATDGGLGIIEYVPFTLAEKAAFYEAWMENWGMKRLGFTHKLELHDGEWIREVSDNDGGWSAEYLAAMSFKYAVTGEESARAEATNTFEALKWTEEITPIDGYPARSIWAKGEKGNKSMGTSGGFDAEWHDSADGLFEWKADTSSDETDAQYFGVAIFHELAADEKQKKQSAEHLARITDHIISSGWHLTDMDGKPTRWGRWEPEYLQRPIGYYARGLNGLEILTYVRTARALTGDSKYDAPLQELIELRYPPETIRQKLVFPPGFINHSDDRMAFFCYFTVLRYETDPHLRSIYRRGLERSWEIERMENNPFFNIIYGSLTGNECELDKATSHLREWPLDLVDHSCINSHRADIHTPEGYASYVGGIRALSPRERGPMRWSNSPFQLDDGSGARTVTDPSAWLETYWMARFFGMISAPVQGEIQRANELIKRFGPGAAAYSGPPRPPLKSAQR